MLILGLNAFHVDSAAALVRDGQLVAAAEEERFRRVKHWAGFPSHSIAYCLREAGVRLRDIDHIAVNQDGKAQLLRKIIYVLGRGTKVAPLLLSRFKTREKRKSIIEYMRDNFPDEPIHASLAHIEHHVCHMFSAYYVSPFEDAAILSVDGFGDFSSAAWGVGERGTVSVHGRVIFPHSLGLFYQTLTQYLGFPNYGDEYKVMGLAPSGAPSYLSQMREIVKLTDGGFKLDLSYFRHQIEELPTQWSDGSPEFNNLFTPALEAVLGPRRISTESLEQRHRDIACSVQAMYEEAFFHMVKPLEKMSDTLTLAGGCAANSVANGKVRRRTSFKRVYVQSAAGDAGGAIGAAFATWQKLGGQRHFVMDHAFWGPQFSRQEIEKVLSARHADIEADKCAVELIANEGSLCARSAELIAEGKVLGWFQGRMEWGPRALGNRSILADPRRNDMKAILNAKIKRRESFRPFAPSILDRAVREWFEEDDAVPFMMQVFQIRAEKRAQIPAVTHVDGSGRLQTVTRAANPRYYRLIESFFQISGIPMILNTSFNENEPVVCTPEEALNCFLRTQMDALVLGDFMIERRK